MTTEDQKMPENQAHTEDQATTPSDFALTVPEPPNEEPLIGILAGESSGDLLGGSLMEELKILYPKAQFMGIGGPKMIAAGLESLHDMERLSVMGFVEPLKRLPELMSIRRSVVSHMKARRPDIFISIDSPDFNLGVAKRLKGMGIKTIHYVSPSVWAWRQDRVKKIRGAVDRVLCLLPFEANFFEKHNIPSTFVGHPMADEIALDTDKREAKKRLGIEPNKRCLAVLPGSRLGEVNLHANLFLHVVKQFMAETAEEEIEVLIPAVSNETYDHIASAAASINVKPRIFLGQSREILAAADTALVASGTATLECMLMKTPMVVAYRLEKLTYAVAKRLVKTEHIALPNLLADRAVVEEFIQDDATEAALFDGLMKLHNDSDLCEQMRTEFRELHDTIQCDASRMAANMVSQHIA